MPAPRSLVIAFVLVAAASPAGCGGGNDGDAEQITDLTEQFAADARAHHWKAVCDAMSAKAKASITAGGGLVGAGDCAAIIGRLYALDDSPEALSADVRVSNIDVTGDRATARVTPTFPGEDPTLRYVREDGAWKLDYTAAGGGS
jgi:hypothetical protein